MPKKKRAKRENKRQNNDIYIDANGCLTEIVRFGDDEGALHVHYDDLPESDITTVHGLPCTTALRTVIDIAVQTPEADLRQVLRDFIDRGEFSLEDAKTRLDQPDMASRRGAEIVRQILFP